MITRIFKKRGIFFTMAAMIIMAVLLISFSIDVEYKQAEQMDAIGTRLETTNYFINDVEDDLQRGLYILSYRALLSLEQYVATNGTFLNDTESDFRSMVINGTVGNISVDLMVNMTFVDWLNKIKTQAGSIGIIINITIEDVSIKQRDPWNVEVNLTTKMMVADSSNTALWYIDKQIITKVRIEDLEDPVYTVNSLGKIANVIKKSNYTDFSDIDNLKIHLNNSYYIESNSAPSFLMRLEGNLSNSSFGIESLVNLEEFSRQGLQTYSKSSVDYIYFGNRSVNSCIVNETYVDGAFQWFRLDSDAEPDNHLDEYNVKCR